jgi:hypothetical protein
LREAINNVAVVDQLSNKEQKEEYIRFAIPQTINNIDKSVISVKGVV